MSLFAYVLTPIPIFWRVKFQYLWIQHLIHCSDHSVFRRFYSPDLNLKVFVETVKLLLWLFMWMMLLLNINIQCIIEYSTIILFPIAVLFFLASPFFFECCFLFSFKVLVSMLPILAFLLSQWSLTNSFVSEKRLERLLKW